MNIFETKNLVKVYGADKENQVKALHDVNIKIEKGEFVAIIGTSGSGKSTLLHILGGLDSPSEGKVLFQDKDIYSMSDRELAIFRRRNIGFVFQFFNLLPELSAKENIVLPTLLDKRKIDIEWLQNISETLGIAERLEHYPNQLSGGQQQRVAIARALVNAPEVLLCDEPTGNLDEKSSEDVVRMLELTKKEYKKTIILVTHDNKIAERADRIIRIKDGKVENIANI